jgi:ribosomal protein L37AE/L43A
MVTKKVKQTGKYGVRAGRGIRQKYLLATKTDESEYECPNCGYKGKIKRKMSGVFVCRKCNTEIAGAAYKLSSKK